MNNGEAFKILALKRKHHLPATAPLSNTIISSSYMYKAWGQKNWHALPRQAGQGKSNNYVHFYCIVQIYHVIATTRSSSLHIIAMICLFAPSVTTNALINEGLCTIKLASTHTYRFTLLKCLQGWVTLSEYLYAIHTHVCSHSIGLFFITCQTHALLM